MSISVSISISTSISISHLYEDCCVFRPANWRTADNDSFELTSLDLVNVASGYPQIATDTGM